MAKAQNFVVYAKIAYCLDAFRKGEQPKELAGLNFLKFIPPENFADLDFTKLKPLTAKHAKGLYAQWIKLGKTDDVEKVREAFKVWKKGRDKRVEKVENLEINFDKVEKIGMIKVDAEALLDAIEDAAEEQIEEAIKTYTRDDLTESQEDYVADLSGRVVAEMRLFIEALRCKDKPEEASLLPPSIPNPDTPCSELTVGQMRDFVLWRRYLELKKYFNQ